MNTSFGPTVTSKTVDNYTSTVVEKKIVSSNYDANVNSYNPIASTASFPGGSALLNEPNASKYIETSTVTNPFGTVQKETVTKYEGGTGSLLNPYESSVKKTVVTTSNYDPGATTSYDKTVTTYKKVEASSSNVPISSYIPPPTSLDYGATGANNFVDTKTTSYYDTTGNKTVTTTTYKKYETDNYAPSTTTIDIQKVTTNVPTTEYIPPAATTLSANKYVSEVSSVPLTSYVPPPSTFESPASTITTTTYKKYVTDTTVPTSTYVPPVSTTTTTFDKYVTDTTIPTSTYVPPPSTYVPPASTLTTTTYDRYVTDTTIPTSTYLPPPTTIIPSPSISTINAMDVISSSRAIYPYTWTSPFANITIYPNSSGINYSKIITARNNIDVVVPPKPKVTFSNTTYENIPPITQEGYSLDMGNVYPGPPFPPSKEIVYTNYGPQDNLLANNEINYQRTVYTRNRPIEYPPQILYDDIPLRARMTREFVNQPSFYESEEFARPKITNIPRLTANVKKLEGMDNYYDEGIIDTVYPGQIPMESRTIRRRIDYEDPRRFKVTKYKVFDPLDGGQQQIIDKQVSIQEGQPIIRNTGIIEDPRLIEGGPMMLEQGFPPVPGAIVEQPPIIRGQSIERNIIRGPPIGQPIVRNSATVINGPPIPQPIIRNPPGLIEDPRLIERGQVIVDQGFPQVQGPIVQPLDSSLISNPPLQPSVIAGPPLQQTVINRTQIQPSVIAGPPLQSTVISQAPIQPSVIAGPPLQQTVINSQVQPSVIAGPPLQSTVISQAPIQPSVLSGPPVEQTIVRHSYVEDPGVVERRIVERSVVDYPPVSRTVDPVYIGGKPNRSINRDAPYESVGPLAKKRRFIEYDDNTWTGYRKRFVEFGDVDPVDDYTLEGWKKYYPADEKYFIWDKGTIYANQRKIYNENDPNNFMIYEGDLNEDGERHGYGELITPQYIRRGQWRHDQFSGWGIESRRGKGEVVEGRFVDGLLNGKGILRNRKGATYIGDFMNGKRHGEGKLTTKTFEYDGEFKNNKMDGKGKINYFDRGCDYEGDFRDNELTGRGIFRWKNGDVYEGQMQRGKMNGKGIYRYANGQIYEGSYIDGIKEGLGRLTFPNGKVFDGEFHNGKASQLGSIITSS